MASSAPWPHSLYPLLSSHSCQPPFLVSPPPWLMPFLSFFSLPFPVLSFPFFYLSLSFFKKNDSLNISFNTFSACTTFFFPLNTPKFIKPPNPNPNANFGLSILFFNLLTLIWASHQLLGIEVFYGVWSQIYQESYILNIVYLFLSWKLSSVKSSSVKVRIYESH